ncbi:MAG: amino acid ABC transporter permease [Syntrophomonadaceae bacterium]|jgi:putative lysine transport system permease protein|nr:amino acid ABC transporter permease [Syntrophomonadaceae bacterium]
MEVDAASTFFEWVYYIILTYWPLFLRGAGVTLLISLTGTIVGFGLGIIIGVIRTIPIDQNFNIIQKGLLKLINIILLAYIEVFRGTPMMVQAMVIFYGAAMVYNISLSPIYAGIFIVSINTGAYMAEIVRGGIISIDKGQFEAAHSIGMTHAQTMFSIVLPQAIRNILPALSNEFVINIKDTSVLSVISVTELFFISKSAAGVNYRFFEVFLVTCTIYFIMTFTVTRILRYFEIKLEGPSVYTIHGSQTVPEAEIRITDRERH